VAPGSSRPRCLQIVCASESFRPLPGHKSPSNKNLFEGQQHFALRCIAHPQVFFAALLDQFMVIHNNATGRHETS
jgi:hypothetical protein